MIIIETCPKCGLDLQDLVICTYPPIPRKECRNCGWSWEGEREEIVRVPFDDNLEYESYINDFVKMGYSKEDSNTLANLATEVSTFYDNYLDTSEAANAFMKTYNDLVNPFLKDSFENNACESCSANPKNGGTGICFCTLGQKNIAY